jgi:hypothetical protein
MKRTIYRERDDSFVIELIKFMFAAVVERSKEQRRNNEIIF